MPPNDAAPRYLEPLLGVVFDLDGTLVVSSHDFARMRREVIRLAERAGVIPGHLTPGEPIHAIMEKARSELLANNVPEGAVFRMEAEAHQLIDAIELEALPKTVARPGAAELLRVLADRGFRLAVLTRSAEQFCRAALQKTGLAEYFPYLRSRSSPGPAKPSPEALLLLLKEMEVPPDRALYVGDHQIDAECATRARVRFYGLLPEGDRGPTAMTVDRFLTLGASAVARDLPDLGRHLGVASASTAEPAR
ncbi:MAG: HAD family hydrolase [Thermoplasmata archaeon]|nr:HAD family hydrolase [Thermoplasmata archaeon]